jgi:hypothetical protein
MPTPKTSKKTRRDRRDRRRCVHFHDFMAGECIVHELRAVFGCTGAKGCKLYAEQEGGK